MSLTPPSHLSQLKCPRPPETRATDVETLKWGYARKYSVLLFTKSNKFAKVLNELWAVRLSMHPFSNTLHSAS